MSPKPTLAIIGLGYVGLPLAYAFARNGYTVHGFDINEERIAELQSGHDRTNEITNTDLQSVSINYTNDPAILKECDMIILAIPTPVTDDKKPDLTPVEKASETVGKNLKKGAIVVYESTVYPGVTEEICRPILEKESGMTCGEDFFLGYSPERVNPGDKEHTIDKIVKVVAGQNDEITDKLCDLYGSIITAGVHRAPNIKTAEMSKAIENAQRDLNIAYVNEIAMLCHKIGISTDDVLDAAATKWNFLPFRPGLVGGHCIGVDPYYLVEKAKLLGMDTHVITAGRAVNDNMANLVVDEVLEAIGGNGKVLVMGLTFKENVPDTRNSQSFAVIKALQEKDCDVFVHDAESAVPERLPKGDLSDGPFDAVLLLVAHQRYIELGTQSVIDAVREGGLVYDLKGILNKKEIISSGRTYIAL